MKVELKTCPFCGGEARYVEMYAHSESGESSGFVKCGKIVPCCEQGSILPKKSAYIRWNRRADNA